MSFLIFGCVPSKSVEVGVVNISSKNVWIVGDREVVGVVGSDFLVDYDFRVVSPDGSSFSEDMVLLNTGRQFSFGVTVPNLPAGVYLIDFRGFDGVEEVRGSKRVRVRDGFGDRVQSFFLGVMDFFVS